MTLLGLHAVDGRTGAEVQVAVLVQKHDLRNSVRLHVETSVERGGIVVNLEPTDALRLSALLEAEARIALRDRG